MTQNRNLLIGGVALVKGKLKNAGPAMVEVCDDLDSLLATAKFFEKAPFRCVSLIIRYGLTNKTEPEYQPVVKKYGELPVTVELSMDMLKSADKKGELKQVFFLATLEVLIDIANKYNLPDEVLLDKKKELTIYPTSI